MERVVVNKGRTVGATEVDIMRAIFGVSPATVLRPSPADVERDYMRWRGWRRLVGHEAFWFGCPGKFAKAAIRQGAAA